MILFEGIGKYRVRLLAIFGMILCALGLWGCEKNDKEQISSETTEQAWNADTQETEQSTGNTPGAYDDTKLTQEYKKNNGEPGFYDYTYMYDADKDAVLTSDNQDSVSVVYLVRIKDDLKSFLIFDFENGIKIAGEGAEDVIPKDRVAAALTPEDKSRVLELFEKYDVSLWYKNRENFEPGDWSFSVKFQDGTVALVSGSGTDTDADFDGLLSELMDVGSPLPVNAEELGMEELGVTLPDVIYGDESRIIMYDFRGIYVYDTTKEKLVGYSDFRPIDMTLIQGENPTFVEVSSDGSYVKFYNKEKKYLYDVEMNDTKEVADYSKIEVDFSADTINMILPDDLDSLSPDFITYEIGDGSLVAVVLDTDSISENGIAKYKDLRLIRKDEDEKQEYLIFQ